MNILRWKRKSKKKFKFKTLILFIFSLLMTTLAWFAYSKVLEPNLNIHMASWDMEYYIGADKKTNPIGIEIPILYPAMEEQTVTIDIKNNGETLVDIEYQVQSITIAGISYEIIQEGEEIPAENQNYIVVASSVPETDEVTGKQIYKGVITNDITKFPFTIEVEHSAQVEAITEDLYGNGVAGEGYLTVTVNWIGDNSNLDSEWGYTVGEYFTNNPDATSAMSILLSIDSYQANPEGEIITETLPTTSETKPYLPTGFTRIPGTTLETGLAIKDSSGNEYVWIEVPRTTTVYPNAGLGITSFTDTEYTTIETDLKSYSATYRTRDDAYSSYNALGIAESRYNTLKQTMLKSIYENGGFYIGRYETGKADTSSTTPVIKAHAYPYNNVTCSQAQNLASSIESGSNTTSLMFGLQWDLVMKYLETKGVSQSTLTTDSTSFGNYANNTYDLINSNLKYSLNDGTEWINPPYAKTSGEKAILTTGANSTFNLQNIYDLVGNLSEWTFNVTFNGSTPVGGNGGDYLVDGTNSATYCSNTYSVLTGAKQVGFRVALY